MTDGHVTAVAMGGAGGSHRTWDALAGPGRYGRAVTRLDESSRDE